MTRQAIWMFSVQTAAILYAQRHDRGVDWAASVVSYAAKEIPAMTQASNEELGRAAYEYVKSQAAAERTEP